jgi:hypothetical protein
MSDLILIVPLWVLLGAWMLAPYWGAWRLQRRESTTTAGRLVALIAALAVTALAANSYLATSAFVGGKPHPTADGATILIIPIAQWIVLGGAGLLRRLVRMVWR